jgi:hypothetical protein
MMASYPFTRQHTSNERATTFTCGSRIESGEVRREEEEKGKKKGSLEVLSGRETGTEQP